MDKNEIITRLKTLLRNAKGSDVSYLVGYKIAIQDVILSIEDYYNNLANGQESELHGGCCKDKHRYYKL